MNLSRTIGEIISSGSEDELRAVNSAVVERLKLLRKLAGQTVRLSLTEKARVSFRSRSGVTVTGKIISIARSKAVVETDPIFGVSNRWNVPFNLLTILED